MANFNVLSIDCATEVCSVALTCGEQCWQVENRTTEKHSQTILPMIAQVLERASVCGSDLSLIAVGAGPGSFTGVRTALGIAQGLAFGWAKPLVGVNTLHALASSNMSKNKQRVLALMDARMHEVYASVIDVDDGAWCEVQPAAVMRPAQLDRWLCSPVDVIVSHGLDISTTDLAALGAPIRLVAPNAQQVGRLGLKLVQQGAQTDPQLCLPLYVRDQVALTITQRAQLERAA
jgi:tRNA threonylcarbamoyladenosine biosynthesis protein TsaB